MNELSKCVCGCEDIIVVGNGLGKYYGLCKNDECEIAGPTRPTREDAAEAWNKLVLAIPREVVRTRLESVRLEIKVRMDWYEKYGESADANALSWGDDFIREEFADILEVPIGTVMRSSRVITSAIGRLTFVSKRRSRFVRMPTSRPSLLPSSVIGTPEIR